MTKYVFFCYHRKEDNVLETCVNSFRHACPEARILIATDGVPANLKERFHKEYGVAWIQVPVEKMVKRRATCKIEVLNSLVQAMSQGDEVLVSDVDVYFLDDPFVPFKTHRRMDLGVTTRGYSHLFPINGGIFYIRVSDKMKDWMKWHEEQVHHPTWPPYVLSRKRYRHEHFGLDWSVGQDFLITNWLRREDILEQRGIRIEDAGPEYNYCPPTDTLGEKAFQMARKAVEERTVSVLHLKSDLKRMVYDDVLPLAKTNNPKGTLAWL
jgi:hypothetical protein